MTGSAAALVILKPLLLRREAPRTHALLALALARPSISIAEGEKVGREGEQQIGRLRDRDRSLDCNRESRVESSRVEWAESEDEPD